MPTPSQNIHRITELLNQTIQLTEKSEIVLFHINSQQMRQAIWSERAWGTVDETARTVWEQAKQHAEAMGGPQKFSVSTYDLDDKKSEHPLRTTVFTLDAGMAVDSDTAGSEPPTQTGLLAQLMRHNQEMTRQFSSAIGALTYQMAKTIERQGEQVEKLMADRLNSLSVMEDLTSRRHERELETQKAQASIERNKEIFQRLSSFLPIIVNKVTGKELTHQKHTAFEATSLQLIETLTPTKLDNLASSGIFSQDQLLLLSTMLEQATKMMVTPEEKKERTDLATKSVFGGIGEALGGLVGPKT